MFFRSIKSQIALIFFVLFVSCFISKTTFASSFPDNAITKDWYSIGNGAVVGETIIPFSSSSLTIYSATLVLERFTFATTTAYSTEIDYAILCSNPNSPYDVKVILAGSATVKDTRLPVGYLSGNEQSGYNITIPQQSICLAGYNIIFNKLWRCYGTSGLIEVNCPDYVDYNSDEYIFITYSSSTETTMTQGSFYQYVIYFLDFAFFCFLAWIVMRIFKR